MPGTQHFAVPTALEYFAALVAEDAGLPLTEAAISLAQDDEPMLDAQAVLAEIDALAARLRRRLPADAAPLQRLRVLNTFFFHELGFGGNVNDYHDRRNSYLHEVLRTRRGIPVSLAVLYAEIAGQVGLRAQGVSFPGHFLVKLPLPQGEVVIDPFSGLSLSREELDERLAPFRRRFGAGEPALPLGAHLQAATARETLSRMLRNLKEIHRQAGDLPRLVAVLHRLVVLQPQAWTERRDRALALAALGHRAAAAQDLACYLRECPLAGDAPRLREQLALWQRGPGALRH